MSPRVNIYLPEDLARAVRSHRINISRVTQEALRRELAADRVDAWLDEVAGLVPAAVDHEEILKAVHESRVELESDGGQHV